MYGTQMREWIGVTSLEPHKCSHIVRDEETVRKVKSSSSGLSGKRRLLGTFQDQGAW